jgi:hypothetical protein
MTGVLNARIEVHAVYDERLFLGAWQKRLLINCRYFIENVGDTSWMTLLVPITSYERCPCHLGKVSDPT